MVIFPARNSNIYNIWRGDMDYSRYLSVHVSRMFLKHWILMKAKLISPIYLFIYLFIYLNNLLWGSLIGKEGSSNKKENNYLHKIVTIIIAIYSKQNTACNKIMKNINNSLEIL
jgi:hypothetical protein